LPGIRQLVAAPVRDDVLLAVWLHHLATRLNRRWVRSRLSNEEQELSRSIEQSKFKDGIWTLRR
jgi:hypothetical protein